MKRNSGSHGVDPERYESYDLSDTRYYGVFLKGQGKDGYVLIDPKRYEKHFALTEEMKAVIKKRVGPHFRPAKKQRLDYNINYMSNELAEIRRRWEKTYKPIIDGVLSEIKGKRFTPGDIDLYQCGIIDPTEAAISANMESIISQQRAENEKNTLYYSLYAQFFHHLVSQIEALFVRVLARNGCVDEKFNRNVVYHFREAKHEKTTSLDISDLEGFPEYAKMYLIWHFLKHNNFSTYKPLKEKFPEALFVDEYRQGDLACFFVKFDDSLIETILTGVERFAKEYCRLVFGEDEKEASWNSSEYFLNKVQDAIEAGDNPLGIPWYL